MNIKKHAFLNFPLRNKKGALELSVTAIVILILAIVMLGLGLGFIRGMFGKVSTSFEEQIAAEPEPPAPSGSEPITLSRDTIITTAKEAQVLKVAVYNPTNADFKEVTAGASCTNLPINGTSNIKTITQGASEKFSILFNTPKNAQEGAYLCQTFIGNSTKNKIYTRDFTIKVTK